MIGEWQSEKLKHNIFTSWAPGPHSTVCVCVGGRGCKKGYNIFSILLGNCEEKDCEFQ